MKRSGYKQKTHWIAWALAVTVRRRLKLNSGEILVCTHSYTLHSQQNRLWVSAESAALFRSTTHSHATCAVRCAVVTTSRGGVPVPGHRDRHTDHRTACARAGLHKPSTGRGKEVQLWDASLARAEVHRAEVWEPARTRGDGSGGDGALGAPRHRENSVLVVHA